MIKLIATAFAASVAVAVAAPSYAMPMAPAGFTASDVIHVAGGCGPGWHRGPYGGCRRNWANPAAHACPRGYHIGPGGRCRGNGR
jgi:hypothetical protein